MLKHIAIGLFIPYCFFFVLYVRGRFRMKSETLAVFPFVFFFCAFWSIVPNIIGNLPLGFLGRLFNNFFISNIFFFHGILSRLDTTGSTWGLGMVFIIFFSLIFIFARHLRLQEKEISELQKKDN